MNIFSQPETKAQHVSPCEDGESFEDCMRRQVGQANMFYRRSGNDAPWEVVMAHVIALEKRVSELEREKAKQ